MSETEAPVTIDAPTTIPVEADTPASISPSEAARQLAQFRWNRDNPKEDDTGDTAGDGTSDDDNRAGDTPTDDAAPPDEAPGETTDDQQQDDQEAELPPIDPPRSWSAADREAFAKQPREVQEILARRETERDTATRRAQNEAAEQRKSSEEALSRAEQLRAQYEQALPVLLQTMQESAAGEFGDIQTMADVEKLARDDWPRYALWDAQQKKIAAVQQEMQQAQYRQHQESQNRWNTFVVNEDKSLLEKVPELSNKEVAEKFAQGAVKVLREVGFSDQDLSQLWTGEASLSLRDHRLQMLIMDGVRFREAKSKVAKPAPKKLPPVQRPGSSQPRRTAADAEVQALEERFNETGNLRDAAALHAAKLRAAQK